MASARDISAKEVMDTDHVTVSTDNSLTQVKNRMEENNLRTIPVVNNGKLKGAVSYRELIRHVQFTPSEASVEEVMHQPPEFETSESLFDLSDLRINSGRKLLVTTEDDRLKGVIGDKEFVSMFEDVEEFQDITTLDIGSLELKRVFEEDSLEKARHIMLDNNISRLPVLDENGNLTGIIRSTDLLKIIVNMESPESTGKKGPVSARESGDEKNKMSEIPVRELMNRTPLTVDDHIDADEAIRKMERTESDDLLVVDEQYPEAIVTTKDFLSYLESMTASDTVLVNLVGLDIEEEKAAVHDKVATQLRGSLGRKLDQPEELAIHVKKAEKDGKKHRYEITTKLHSELGMMTVETDGWELLDAVDQALNEMNTLVRKKKDKQKEHR